MTGAVSGTQPPSMARRFGKWLGITAIFAFIPILFDMAVLEVRDQDITAASLFAGAPTYLIGFSICVASLGDALFDREYSGRMDGWTLCAVIASIVALVNGAGLYALSKSEISGDWHLPLFYVIIASMMSLFTVWTTGR